MHPLAVKCPYCLREAGADCVDDIPYSGRVTLERPGDPHPARKRLANGECIEYRYYVWHGGPVGCMTRNPDEARAWAKSLRDAGAVDVHVMELDRVQEELPPSIPGQVRSIH